LALAHVYDTLVRVIDDTLFPDSDKDQDCFNFTADSSNSERIMKTSQHLSKFLTNVECDSQCTCRHHQSSLSSRCLGEICLLENWGPIYKESYEFHKFFISFS